MLLVCDGHLAGRFGEISGEPDQRLEVCILPNSLRKSRCEKAFGEGNLMEVDDSQQKLDSWILFELASPKEIYHNTENTTKPTQFRCDNLLYINYLKFCQASS